MIQVELIVKIPALQVFSDVKVVSVMLRRHATVLLIIITLYVKDMTLSRSKGKKITYPLIYHLISAFYFQIFKYQEKMTNNLRKIKTCKNFYVL